MRRLRYQRDPQALPHHLTCRDIKILKSIALFKYLTSQQVAHLFNSSRGAINKRLKFLFHHHYLGKLPGQLSPNLFNSPDIYFIDLNRKASRILAEQSVALLNHQRVKQKIPKRDYVQHTLLTNDCLIAFEVSVRKYQGIDFLPSHKLLMETLKKKPNRSHPWKVSAFMTEQNLSRTAFPDAAFALFDKRSNKTQLFLVEADRMTQPLIRRDKQLFRTSNIKAKLLIYHTAWKQGVFRERLGYPATRIIFVTLSAERAKHMWALATELFGKKAPGLFVFTDINNLSPEAFNLAEFIKP
ncbi:MAG: replication-relaxation family protein [Rhodomicrobiaceae bacterium]